MYKYLTFVFVFFSVLSCKQDPENLTSTSSEKDEILARSNGSHAELLLMINDDLFDSEVGETVLKYFDAEQYGLPQPESVFKLLKVAPVKANRLLKRNKSILIIQLADTTSLTIHQDVWARPQIVVTITAATKEELVELLEDNNKVLVEKFQAHDQVIMENVLRKSSNKNAPKELKELGIGEVVITRGFKQTLERENLKIYKNKGLRTDQYLIFYTEPMREGVVSGEEIVRSRDSIGKNYMQGYREGSYLATETIMPPVQNIVEVGDMFAVETRGLWKTVGDFMGGPFISYTIYDDINNQIITVEGMVYGPDSKKRNVLFELETMIRSVRLIKK